MNKHYFPEINIAKGIAILCVLLHHSFILYPINVMEEAWGESVRNAYTPFYLNIFFLISGFLYGISSKKELREVLPSKWRRIGIPYLSFCAITLGLKIAFPSLINRKVESFGSYFYNFLFKGSELWFLYVLFLMFIIWPLLLSKIKSKWIPLVAFGCLVVHLSGLLPENSFMRLDRICYCSIFFLIGFSLKDAYGTKFTLRNNITFMALLISYVLTCCIFRTFFNMISVYTLLNVVVSCAFILALAQRIVGKRIQYLFNYCGKYSLQFYVFNGFALIPARTLVVKIFDMQNSIMIVMSIFLLSVLFTIIMTEICLRTKLTRIMFGYSQ